MAQTGKTSPRKLWVPFILLLALVPASCASTGGSEKKSLESLKASVDAFNSTLRWEDYTSAAAFVPADKKEQFWAYADRFKGKIHIIDYQVREVAHMEKSRSATAIVFFQYWRTDSPTVRTVNISQKWYYDEKDKVWKVYNSGFGVIAKSEAAF
ncbi:MAG: hypothetical protein ABSG91_06805 [Syntrophobacteraceae bacterium]